MYMYSIGHLAHSALCLFYHVKGKHSLCKKLSKYQEPKCVNPETSFLLLKPWNSICNRWYRTTYLIGGAPFSNMCLYLQSGEDVSLSFIKLNVPYKWKHSCAKTCFPCLSETVSLSLV